MAKKQTHKKNEQPEKIEELENLVRRSVADYQNLEKRTAEERVGWIKTANRDFILKLLPTLDHLDTALKGAKDSGENSGWLQGVEMAVGEFRKILKEEGLEQVPTETFDPNLHEAVGTGQGPTNAILEVLQMGYNLNGKLIRPAKVIVGKE